MTTDFLKTCYQRHLENALADRYICNDSIVPILENLDAIFRCSEIGKSVTGEPIFSVTFGTGSKRILMWSQMHGNESTTTKAIFDLFSVISKEKDAFQSILEECTIVIIPILNPDGARAYTRVNANTIDLNRDALDLSQPESRILRSVFEEVKPHYCFNLHGQRTIFSVTDAINSATLSFLSPAEDEARTISDTRKVAMSIIATINTCLQEQLPNQIGRYDDTYNANCVGDTFQSLGVPTVLFEAGHFKSDYSRDVTRQFIFESLCIALNTIASETINSQDYQLYLEIPENEKKRNDIIIRNGLVKGKLKDIAIQFEERLIDGRVEFIPIVASIVDKNQHKGHKEIDASGNEVLTCEFTDLHEGYENDFVLINHEEFLLKP